MEVVHSGRPPTSARHQALPWQGRACAKAFLASCLMLIGREPHIAGCRGMTEATRAASMVLCLALVG